ncbi:MAG: hypothetical protein P8011_17285 [Acidihalobacter sp.]|jgi:hypothetical protein|uniref:DUF6580 family putative transport protein n=1 Tax=Acidihalobacter sp. TaxID=1872108 RepID=UPI00307EFE26
MNPRLFTIVALIFAAAALRLIPHPANVAPIAALALFAGSYLEDRRLAFAVPFGALLLSDSVLGLYPGLVFVYAGFALSVCVGFALRKRNVVRIAAGTLISALVFFLITNFGAWMTLPMYPKTPEGLLAAYVAGIPFLRNALVGDVLYVGVLFGGFALAERRLRWLGRPLAHT